MKNQAYLKIKTALEKNNFICEPYQEINFGLQFKVTLDQDPYLIRIYESKKGITIDLSQIKQPEIKQILQSYLSKAGLELGKKNQAKTNQEILNLTNLIGTDESGKGDYFGPLTVAGVYLEQNQVKELQKIGVQDSKNLTNQQNLVLAKRIKEICPNNLIVVSNPKYNEFYSQIKNLNKLLAYFHAQVIMNLLKKVENCEQVLVDQFSTQNLVEDILKKEGLNLKVNQCERAEENLAVAAASILARAAFLEQLNLLSSKYKFNFPRGAGTPVLVAVKEFKLKFGEAELANVAKKHFKITN